MIRYIKKKTCLGCIDISRFVNKLYTNLVQETANVLNVNLAIIDYTVKLFIT